MVKSLERIAFAVCAALRMEYKDVSVEVPIRCSFAAQERSGRLVETASLASISQIGTHGHTSTSIASGPTVSTGLDSVSGFVTRMESMIDLQCLNGCKLQNLFFAKHSCRPTLVSVFLFSLTSFVRLFVSPEYLCVIFCDYREIYVRPGS